MQYTDLSQFGNLAITNIEPPQTNRLTLGVWVNVASISKMSSSTMPLQISFSSGSAKIRVIFYILKLDIGSSSLRTIYGTATCSTDSDCIEGYSCIGSTCQSY